MWLLSNVTGSEEFYFYGLNFIRKFYEQNVLEEDYASTKITLEELLIKESIITSILNYLSNLKIYQEVEVLMDAKKLNSQNQDS